MAPTSMFLDSVIDGVPPEHFMTSSRVWLEVRGVMSRDVVTVSSDDTVASAANVMSRRNISCVVVLDDGAITGILTERDLLRKVALRGMDFGRAKVVDAMSSPVECAAPDSSVLDCGKIMEEKHIRRLPVLEGEQLVGIVTQTDLTVALTSYGLWRDVAEIMNRDTAVVQRQATVEETAGVMSSRNISCILVLEGEEVAGVVTERDLLKKVVALQKDPTGVTVEEVMSSPVLSVHASCSVFSASRFMERMNIRRLAVMEDKRLCGIVTQTDIFAAVRRKLQEEEEENLEFLDSSEYGIYTANLYGKTMYVNNALTELLGVSDSGKLLNEPFLPARFWVNPEERAHFVSEMREKGFIGSREVGLISARGRRVYFTLSSTFTKNIRGEINGSQGILRDITADKEIVALMEAKEELRESEERYRTLSQNIPVGLYRNTLGSGGQFVMANQALARMHGYDAVEELLATSVSDLYWDPAERQVLSEKLLAQGEIVAEEVRLKKRDGTLIWGAVTARVVRDESGEVKWFDGMVEDVTEHKQAEKELRESEERYRVLFEASTDGVVIVDSETRRFKYANPVLCKLLGYTEEELRGMGVDDIHPTDELERVISEFQAQSKGGDSVAENIPCVRKDGSVVCVDINTAVAVIDARQCTIGFFRDVTERKRAEEELHNYTRDLERFNQVAVGREKRMIELKAEINGLLRELGREEKYRSPHNVSENGSLVRKTD